MANNTLNATSTIKGLVPGSGSITATGTSEGAQMSSEVDGKWYQRAKSGQLFIASTAITLGPVISTIGAASAKSCVLNNPAGSGVNLQVAEITIGANAATAVVGNIGLMYQNPLTTTAATANLGTISSALLGSGFTDPTTIFYSRFTYVGTPTILKTLGISFGTTTMNAGPQTAEAFEDGMVNLAPGSSIGLFSSTAQTGVFTVSMTYARVPTL